jgi:hypothetical protein
MPSLRELRKPPVLEHLKGRNARTKRVHQPVNSRVPDIQRGQAKRGELQAF